ncbi:MAG: ABC transporter ATP-binding protein [Pseudomonadaceae bacterium]|nr:ABC transporter ATP-binding protein [Pseudomonadaceae bacterium]
MSDSLTNTRPDKAASLSAAGDKTVLQAVSLVKQYRQGSSTIDVLQGLDLNLAAGERVAVVGRSGSGKSTLLHVLAGLDTVDSGTVTVRGENMTAADPNRKAALRGAHMGFVYQNHHLLPEFSAVENVAMPIRIAGGDNRTAIEQAGELLTQVGLAERLQHLPSELSGGERQRVAVARALAGNPAVVLADEPTGNLDSETAAVVMALMASLCRRSGTAFLVVTHDVSMLGEFDRALRLIDGQLLPYDN